jgi:pilus assembly protein Flp/PilA
MLFLAKEEGQGLVEYALLIALIALVVIVTLTLLGAQLGNVFSQIITCLPNTDGNCGA